MVDERSYIILRHDGLLIRTKPVTENEAWWLRLRAYLSVEDRKARARYLSEWGNTLDVRDYMERLKQLQGDHIVTALADVSGKFGIYESLDDFEKRVSGLLGERELRPEARQVLEEFASNVAEFLKKPVSPGLLEPLPLRYLEMPRLHLTLRPDGKEGTDPEAEWFAYTQEKDWPKYHEARGISVFSDSLWLWRQHENVGMRMTFAIVVRRDVADGDVLSAAVWDDAVLWFMSWNAEYFKEIVRKNEERLRSTGYEDVVNKAYVILGLIYLLTAGRREEDVSA